MTLYMSPITFVLQQVFNNQGFMANFGSATIYVAGSSTLATTYTDSTGIVPNPNPITLNAYGRLASAMGAPVSVWAASGTVLSLVVTDNAGNQLINIGFMSSINDPASASSLQTLLASPASSNTAGSGPVAGADLVANAVKSYDIFADVRAANAPIPAAGQTITISVQGQTAVNDGVGGLFYWNASSTATDNGSTVLKPNSVTSGPGRWIRLTSSPNGGVVTLISAATTDLGTAGSNNVLISGTTTITAFGSSAVGGSPLYFLKFGGILTLTYNSTSLILPGAGNIITGPNDSAVALYLGNGNWQVLRYMRSTSDPPGDLYIVKPTDQGVASSTTLVSDTALLSPALIAGASYHVQARLQLLSGNASSGYKVVVNFSGTLVDTTTVGGGVNSVAGTAGAIAWTLGTNIVGSTIGTTANDFINVNIPITVSTAGVIQVQFAQDTSETSATTMKAGSCLIITRTN